MKLPKACGQCDHMFTIGHKESYEQGLSEESKLLKKGRCEHNGQPYGGGAAFTTEEGAREYIAKDHPTEGYEVYRLDCGLDNCYWDDKEGFYRIINSTVIQRL